MTTPIAPQPVQTGNDVFTAARANAMTGTYAPVDAAATSFFNSFGKVEDMAAIITDAAKTMAADARALIFGVTPEAMLIEAYAALAECRRSGHVETLVRSALIAVGLGFTVAREWTSEYATLKAPHPFHAFEMSGRAPKAQAAASSVFLDQWVTGSNMNAHAVRIFGHMLVYWAPRGTFLALIGDKAGTIFAPPPESDVSERARLMRESAKAVTAAETAMVKAAADDFEGLVTLVNEIFGQPGATVTQMAAWASSYDDTYI